MVMKSLSGMTYSELSDYISHDGYSDLHIRSVLNSVYRKRVTDIKSISKIPGRLKLFLEENTVIGVFKAVASQISEDRTVKYLFATQNERSFETVFIPESKRTTVCVSTQSGCRMGCPFCVTSGYGFRGNLTAGEIVNQVIGLPDAEKVTHIVFMGMGEPMDNIENILKACEIFTADWGLAISPRNITISTVGILSGVEKFLSECSCNLALSLHSPFSDERRMFVPAEKLNKSHDIINLMKVFPHRKSRRFSVAYMMIKDFNDTDKHLEGLKNLLRGSDIRVNLLPYHESEGSQFLPAPPERMVWFKHNLVISGISASIRKSRGADISAACGLLAKGIS